MSSLSLVIGNKNYSSWSLRAWVFLRHFDVPFVEKRIPLFTGDWQREIQRCSPTARVPVLHDGGMRVWEALAICEYVNERYCAGRGWPEDVESRALARCVSAEMHAGFARLRALLPMNCRATFEGFQIPDACADDIARVVDIWRLCRERAATRGEWLFGAFSVADAMFAPVALRFASYRVPVDATARAYVQSVRAHPCIVEWVEAAAAEPEVIEHVEAAARATS